MAKNKRKKDEQALRVVIGADGQAFAPSWKIWVRGDSVYAAARAMGGVFKLSLHPTVWLSGLTSESGQVFDTGSRVSHRWTPAAEFTPGWTLGAYIRTSRLGGEDEHPAFFETDTENIEWIEPPELASQVTLCIWLARTSEPPAFGGQSGYFEPPFRLPDGRYVWITVGYHRISVDDLRNLTAIRDGITGITITPEVPGGDPGSYFGSVLNVGDRGGTPFIGQIVLTSQSFVIEGNTPDAK